MVSRDWFAAFRQKPAPPPDCGQQGKPGQQDAPSPRNDGEISDVALVASSEPARATRVTSEGGVARVALDPAAGGEIRATGECQPDQQVAPPVACVAHVALAQQPQTTPVDIREFDERAAIIEHEAKASRPLAEAFAHVLRLMPPDASPEAQRAVDELGRLLDCAADQTAAPPPEADQSGDMPW